MVRKMGVIVAGAAAVLFACAQWSSYPIHLRYTPERDYPRASKELKRNVVTVTPFADNRGMTDQMIIGKRVDYQGRETPFVSSRENPSTKVTEAFKAYLFKKGYTISGETPGWDLDVQTVNTQWGDWVIGGSIEELSIAVQSYVRTLYDCKLKLRVVVVDVKEKKYRYNKTIYLSSSYTTATFRLTTAERMINSTLTEAIEKVLVGLDTG